MGQKQETDFVVCYLLKNIARLVGVGLFALLCTTPGAAQIDDTAKRSHIFPQVADGDGWGSVLIATNTASSETMCEFSLYGDIEINRFQRYDVISYSGNSRGAFTIPGNGGSFLWPSRNEDALVTGYAKLDCDAPTTAQIIYLSVDRFGQATGAATVFSSQTGTIFSFRSLYPPGGLGIAIANDSSSATDCRFVMVLPDATEIDTTVTIGSKSNDAQFVSSTLGDLIPAVLDGPTSVAILCDQLVAIIGLHFFNDTTFTTVPATVLSKTPLNTSNGEMKPFNQIQTERLIGRWVFTYETSPSSSTAMYSLRDVRESSANPGDWVVSGTDEDGDLAEAGYIHEDGGSFWLLDYSILVDRTFLFNFVGSSETSVSGCYHRGFDLQCHPMTGTKISNLP